jgi:hypothetical protein
MTIVLKTHDLTEYTRFMLQYLNQNIIDEGMIITLKN